MNPQRLERSIYYDLPKGTPAIGDYLITRGVRGIGSAYLIVGVRRVRRRNPEACARFNLRVQPVAIDADVIRLAKWWMHWYSRSSRPKKRVPKGCFHRLP